MKGTTVGWLYILNPEEGMTDRFPLRNGRKITNIVGRRVRISPPDVNIQLETSDQTISRRHCEIKIKGGPGTGLVYLLSDLGSQRGTSIHKQKDPRQRLSLTRGDVVYLTDQDIIQIGQLQMKIEVLIE